MRKNLILSGVALSALMLGMVPAGAVSLNIGGDGGLVSVDTGTSGGGGSTGGSTTEGSSGGGLLNLGNRPLVDLSGDADVDAAVDLNLGNDRILDLDTDGDDGVIVDLFGEDDAIADVDLGVTGEGDGLLDLGGEKGLVNVETDGNDGVILDLFGKSGAVADVELGVDGDSNLLGVGGGQGATVAAGQEDVLGINGDGKADVNVGLLNGNPADPEVSIALGRGAAAGLLGGDIDATVDLFGPNDTDGATTGSVPPGTGGPTTGGSGTSGPGANGPGDTADSSDDDGSTTGPGAGGPDVIKPAPSVGSVAPVRPAAARVASITTGATTCFSPDQGQIAHLLARNSYSAEVKAELQAAETIQLVPINLCADARAQLDAALAADPNIGELHSAIAADAEISAALEPAYSPDDVLAADPSGEDLTVYVY